ncbi:MAG: hypothetical protein IJC50_02630 [Clostridia bacterium]|nr:hypothetical protein [Clostridia bacterium]
MNKEEFLELLKSALHDYCTEPEKIERLYEYTARAVENVDDKIVSSVTAADVYALAPALSQNGESAVDTFFGLNALEDLPADDGSVSEPDQFFYEFASIEDEPVLVDPILDDDVSGTRTFNTSDVENDVYINNRKLNRVDKLRGRRNIDKSAKNTPLFWILFVLTFPITFPIFAGIWGVIGVLYTAVSVVIAALIAVVVAIVGVGTALALVGLIFGIIKCFSVLPVGLYEIGLAVAVTGVTMLVSVLVYNLAVRLVPKLYSLLSSLGAWVWYNIQKLYYFCKKECDK